MNEGQQKTHLIIIGVPVNEAVVLKVILCDLWCIFLIHPFFVECVKDETKSLLTHGAPPVGKGIGSLYSQYQRDQRKCD